MNNKLLIDQDCPMCALYGNCFVKYGLIDHNSLLSYQVISERESQLIDMDRARTEIALHDTSSGRTIYGLDSIIKIIAGGNRTITNLLNLPLLYIPLQVLYRFISYNRKVIYPTKDNKQYSRTCNPNLNMFYRWAYILAVALFTAIVVHSFTFYLFTSLGWAHNFSTEVGTCFGQIIWQGTAASLLTKKKTLTYLGNMSTVSLIGAIILLPLLFLSQFISFSVPILLGYFTLVVGTMFLEHLRRCEVLGITRTMTASWVGFRVFAMSLILLSLGVINF